MGKEIWNFVPDSVAEGQFKKAYVHELNEFLAERIAKEKIPDHTFSSVIDDVNSYDDVVDYFLTGQKDTAAEILAEIRIQDIVKFNQIKNQLIAEGYDVTKTLQLSDKFIELGDDLLNTGTIQNSKIADVTELVKQLIE